MPEKKIKLTVIQAEILKRMKEGCKVKYWSAGTQNYRLIEPSGREQQIHQSSIEGLLHKMPDNFEMTYINGFLQEITYKDA